MNLINFVNDLQKLIIENQKLKQENQRLLQIEKEYDKLLSEFISYQRLMNNRQLELILNKGKFNESSIK